MIEFRFEKRLKIFLQFYLFPMSSKCWKLELCWNQIANLASSSGISLMTCCSIPMSWLSKHFFILSGKLSNTSAGSSPGIDQLDYCVLIGWLTSRAHSLLSLLLNGFSNLFLCSVDNSHFKCIQLGVESVSVVLVSNLSEVNIVSLSFHRSDLSTWIFVKNEEIQALGSVSSCLANSSKYCIQIHWWATWVISSCFPSE